MVTVIDQNTIVKVVDNLVFNTTGAGGGDLLSTNNLSDVQSTATARANLGLGTASTFNVGTGANNIVQLDGSARLPAIDGSQLTNLPAGFADPMTTRGDLIYRDATNTTSRLGLGTTGQVPFSNGVDLIWSTLASSNLSDSNNITLLTATQTLTNKTITSANNTLDVNADDVDDTTAINKFVTSGDLTTLSNTSGINTGDETAGSIKTKYESNADTNAFTDAEQAKLSNITITQAVDLDTIEANVATNNAKVSNATHTGDVTGATALTIANDVVSNAKLANMTANSIKGRITSTGDPQDLTATQVRTVINVANGATANSTDAVLLNRTNHTGTQLASTISDFQTTVSANTDVTANTAKVTNQTHTGDVTGSIALTAQPAMITGKTLVTAVSGDLVLIVDATDGLLKRVDANDFLGGGGGGEANDGTNLGTGSQVFESKSGVNLQFRTLVNTAEIIVTQNTNDLTFALATNSIANNKLSAVATQTIKGRNTAGTGDVEDLTPTQVRSIINVQDGSQVNTVDSVNSQTGVVVLDTDDITDTATNRYTNDTDITRLANTSGTNTGDEVQATEIALGIAEIATQAEVDAGTDDLRIITPLKLESSTLRGEVTANTAKLNNITVTQAVDLDTLESDVTALKTDVSSGLFDSVSDKTYAIESNAKYAYTIQNISTRTASGTFTLAVQINGTNVTGLGAVSVTTSPLTSNATGANTVNAGDRVTFVATASSSPVDFEFTMEYLR